MTTQENLQINAQVRKVGKHHSRSLRSDRRIPAVVYGPQVDNLHISLLEADVIRYGRRGYENSIFTLKSDDPKINGLKVLRKDTAIHPVSRLPIHMDFFAPNMDVAVRVEVDLRFDG